MNRLSFFKAIAGAVSGGLGLWFLERDKSAPQKPAAKIDPPKRAPIFFCGRAPLTVAVDGDVHLYQDGWKQRLFHYSGKLECWVEYKSI